MRTSDIERITAFEKRFAQAQATDVVGLPWGFAVLQSEFPRSEYHNRIAVTSAAPAADVLAAAEEILGGAGLGHRYVSAEDDTLGQALSADLVAAGYEHETIVTMVYAGPEVEPAGHEVREVSVATLRPTVIRDWRAALPDASDETHAQLADRMALYARGSDVSFLAVYDGDEIAAHGDLFFDREDSIARFENLATHDDFRRRGYGEALLRDALRRSREADAEVSCLTAGLDDWPREWYQRRGYVEVGRTHHFTRR